MVSGSHCRIGSCGGREDYVGAVVGQIRCREGVVLLQSVDLQMTGCWPNFALIGSHYCCSKGNSIGVYSLIPSG